MVVGASSGGLEALRTLVGGLPAQYPGSLFIVLHTSPDSPGVLADILDQASPLPVRYANDGERIEAGRIYVARPDHHLVLEPGVTRVTRGPKENRFRPAVDPLFRSAAQVYGPRAVGVILTGGLDDGTSGLWTIKQLGGTTIVQEPREAIAPSMPLNAIQHVRIDYRLLVADIPDQLIALAATEADEQPHSIPDSVHTEVGIAAEMDAIEAGVTELGSPSVYACPDCQGVLLQLKESGRLRFRCHTGHAHTVSSLLEEMDERIEESLWSSLRGIQERELLLREVAKHVSELDHGATAEELRVRAEETRDRAELVRRAVQRPRS